MPIPVNEFIYLILVLSPTVDKSCEVKSGSTTLYVEKIGKFAIETIHFARFTMVTHTYYIIICIRLRHDVSTAIRESGKL